MKLFETIQGKTLHLRPGVKVIPAEEFSQAVEAKEVLEGVRQEAAAFRLETESEAARIKEEAAKEGFEEGLKRWNEKIAELEQEKVAHQKEMEKALVPLAMTAVKKIIGREIEMKPDTIVDIIATALKGVSHHRKIALYVNKNDLEIVESKRGALKALFEHLQTLTIASREDIMPGGCVIETESGIVNVGLEQQLKALETAFQAFVQSREERKM